MMTKDEAFKQLNGAEMVLLNRDFKSFNQAILMAMDALLDQKRLSNKVKTLAEELEEKGCRLAYYEDLEEQGRLHIAPCKSGEYWRDWNGDRVRIETVSFCKSRSHIGSTDMVTYSYEDEEDDFAVNWTYFKGHFTREEAEQALGGADRE